MAHPLVTIHGSHWTELLKYFRDTIYFLARHDGKTEQQARDLIKTYVDLVEDNKQNIFLATANGIIKYLNFYNVRPSAGVHDEFKGIYFTGMAVSHYLSALGHVDLNKLHLRSVLRLLDLRLALPHGANRTVLSERIKSVINNNELKEHFGHYGWYITYKCLFNSINEKSKTL